jgi:tRNA pseudouridine55 synthase
MEGSLAGPKLLASFDFVTDEAGLLTGRIHAAPSQIVEGPLSERMEGHPWCGVLNLNKPAGITSRQAVDRVKKCLRGTRLGHAGTLDPLATGVLVVCVGAATRLIEYVQQMSKTYRTVVRLGAWSDTLDADGRVTEIPTPRPPDRAEVEAALNGQVGAILQRPPDFSALKVQGERAYDLARKGQTVALAPRLVQIDRIDLIDYQWPRLELEIVCGGGTYIRAIARDLGEALGCGGLVEVLTRTRIGRFTLEGAIDPDDLSVDTIAAHLRPALEAVAELPRLAVTAEQVAALVQGRALRTAAIHDATAAPGEVALVGPDGSLVAIGRHHEAEGWIRPQRVLASSPRVR